MNNLRHHIEMVLKASTYKGNELYDNVDACCRLWLEILGRVHERDKQLTTTTPAIVAASKDIERTHFQNSFSVCINMLYSSILFEIGEDDIYHTPAGKFSISEIVQMMNEIRISNKKAAKELRGKQDYVAKESERMSFLAKVLMNTFFVFSTRYMTGVEAEDIIIKGKERVKHLCSFLIEKGYTIVYVDTDVIYLAEIKTEQDKLLLDLVLDSLPYKTHMECWPLSFVKLKCLSLNGTPKGFKKWENFSDEKKEMIKKETIELIEYK